MTYRDDLVTLIANGTMPEEVYDHFRCNGLLRPSILSLLKQSGASMSVPPGFPTNLL